MRKSNMINPDTGTHHSAEELVYRAMRIDPAIRSFDGTAFSVEALLREFHKNDRRLDDRAHQALRHPDNWNSLFHHTGDRLTVPGYLSAWAILSMGPKAIDRAWKRGSRHPGWAKDAAIDGAVTIRQKHAPLEGLAHLFRSVDHTHETRGRISAIFTGHDDMTPPLLSRESWADPDVVPLLDALGKAGKSGFFRPGDLSAWIIQNLGALALNEFDPNTGTWPAPQKNRMFNVAISRINQSSDLRSFLDSDTSPHGDGFAVVQAAIRKAFLRPQTLCLTNSILNHAESPQQTVNGLPAFACNILLGIHEARHSLNNLRAQSGREKNPYDENSMVQWWTPDLSEHLHQITAAFYIKEGLKKNRNEIGERNAGAIEHPADNAGAKGIRTPGIT